MMRSLNLSGTKMLQYTDRIFNSHKPITADVFLTNYCNNKCPYCTYARWDLDSNAKAMTFEEFKLYAERLVALGVQGIILTGGGEPTLCPDFLKITKWLESSGIHYGVNTNFNKLVYFAPDYLKVSLDGYDEESYLSARGVRQYSNVVNNIKKYSEWKKHNAPHTSLGIQRVVMSVDDVILFYNAHKHFDVNYISFRPIESTNGSFYDGDELKKVKEIITAINDLSQNDSRVVLNFKWNMLQDRFSTCVAEWAQIAINERGEVMYCCHKPYEIVGHIMDDNILDKKAKFQTEMSKCDVPCRMTAPNLMVSECMASVKDVYFI